MMIQSCRQDGQTLEQGYSPHPKDGREADSWGRGLRIALEEQESEGTGLIKEDKFPVSVGAVPGLHSFSPPSSIPASFVASRWPRGEGSGLHLPPQSWMRLGRTQARGAGNQLSEK